MPLNANTLASLITQKVKDVEAGYQNGQKDPDEAYIAICEAIVEHIQADAQVVVASGSSAGTYKVI